MKSYQDLLQDVLDNGRRVPNRTGIDTLSVFGRMFRHDLKKGFPLLTTKKMAWKAIRAELVWLIRGETNVRSLNEQGVHIWDANADEEGNLGPVYGAQWRRWPNITAERVLTAEAEIAEIETLADDGDTDDVGDRLVDVRTTLLGENAGLDIPQVETIDQLAEAVRLLREDPDSRRIIVSAWNVADLPAMRLPPCHYAFQFRSLPRGPNVRELSCMVHMRSADLFLGVPFNIASYAALTCLLARMTGHERGELIMTFGDLHLYVNHLEQAKEQLSRQPHPLPHLEIPTGVELDTACIDDFRLFNYNHHPAIKGDMAV